jgi:hypothetical protein
VENEEKKVKKTTKTTTPKKSTTKTVSTKKVTEKKETAKKTAPKKEPVKEEVKAVKKTTKVEPKKTVAKKETIKKATVKKSEPKIETKAVKKTTKSAPKKEVKIVEPVKEEVKVEKVITKELKEEKISKKELREIRKKRYIIEGIIIAIVVIIGLILLGNRTFLSINYKTDKVNISIPRFSYFVSDEENEARFITLRKSEYIKEYYNEYLEGFTFYSCAEGKNTFYYNDQTKTLIKEIEVEKKFALKIVEIEYDTRTPEEFCGLR